MRLFLLPALLGLLALVPPATAQAPSSTDKLFLHASVGGTRLYFDEDDFDQNDGGGGLTLRAGYSVSRVVTLFAGVSGARMDGENNGVIDDEYDYGVGEIGARFHFGAGRRALVPYLEASLQGAAATYDDRFDLEFSGGALGLGGGLAYYVTPRLALDGGLRFAGGEFDEIDFGDVSFDVDGDDFGFGSAQLSFGLTWFPLR
jgi:hypothetical protein